MSFKTILFSISLVIAGYAVFSLIKPTGAYAAETCTWVGLGADDLWSIDANWSCTGIATLPAPGDSLIFDDAPRLSPDNDLGDDFPINTITIQGTENFTIGGAGILLANGITINQTGAAVSTIYSAITLSADQTFLNQSASAETNLNVIDLNGFDLVINSQNQSVFTVTQNFMPYTITGNGSITKNGSGRLDILCPNDFTGILTINAGTVVAGDDESLGAGGDNSANRTTINGGYLITDDSYVESTTLTIDELLFLNTSTEASGLLNSNSAGEDDTIWAGDIYVTNNSSIGSDSSTGTGTLTITGDVTILVDSATSNSLRVTGAENVIINSTSHLTIELEYPIAISEIIKIFDDLNTAGNGGSLQGEFFGITQGTVILSTGTIADLEVSYLGGNGDDITILGYKFNEIPVNTVPGTQKAKKNIPFSFSTAKGNQITIADADAGTDEVQVTLTATNGKITFISKAGLTFTTGDGTADATVTIIGTIVDINNALNGMYFTPTTNYSGTGSIQIITNDMGNNGSDGYKTDTDTISITIAPDIQSGSLLKQLIKTPRCVKTKNPWMVRCML